MFCFVFCALLFRSDPHLLFCILIRSGQNSVKSAIPSLEWDRFTEFHTDTILQNPVVYSSVVLPNHSYADCNMSIIAVSAKGGERNSLAIWFLQAQC